MIEKFPNKWKNRRGQAEERKSYFSGRKVPIAGMCREIERESLVDI